MKVVGVVIAALVGMAVIVVIFLMWDYGAISDKAMTTIILFPVFMFLSYLLSQFIRKWETRYWEIDSKLSAIQRALNIRD